MIWDNCVFNEFTILILQKKKGAEVVGAEVVGPEVVGAEVSIPFHLSLKRSLNDLQFKGSSPYKLIFEKNRCFRKFRPYSANMR